VEDAPEPAAWDTHLTALCYALVALSLVVAALLGADRAGWPWTVLLVAAGGAWLVGYAVWLADDVRTRRGGPASWLGRRGAQAGEFLEQVWDVVPWGGILAVVVVVALPSMVAQAVDERAAERDEGVRGTYRIVEVDCSGRGRCDPIASFTSDDPEASFSEVGMSREFRGDVGDTGEAQYLDSTGLLYRPGSDEWSRSMAFAVIGALYVGVYALWFVCWGPVARFRASRRPPDAGE
jgi:hypothetical protein